MRPRLDMAAARRRTKITTAVTPASPKAESAFGRPGSLQDFPALSGQCVQLRVYVLPRMHVGTDGDHFVFVAHARISWAGALELPRMGKLSPAVNRPGSTAVPIGARADFKRHYYPISTRCRRSVATARLPSRWPRSMPSRASHGSSEPVPPSPSSVRRASIRPSACR